jgi:hypothetical protein
MKRRISAFYKDALCDWVAELECGHRRHMRHQPPWEDRPWVMTPEGRRRWLGTEVECRTCEAEAGGNRPCQDPSVGWLG